MKATLAFLTGIILGALAVALTDREEPRLPNVEPLPEDWQGWKAVTVPADDRIWLNDAA